VPRRAWLGDGNVRIVFEIDVNIESWPDDIAGGRSHFLVKGGEIGGGKKGQTKANIFW
jgi:hypothetical protein